jgi:hypothetical protein
MDRRICPFFYCYTAMSFHARSLRNMARARLSFHPSSSYVMSLLIRSRHAASALGPEQLGGVGYLHEGFHHGRVDQPGEQLGGGISAEALEGQHRVPFGEPVVFERRQRAGDKRDAVIVDELLEARRATPPMPHVRLKRSSTARPQM